MTSWPPDARFALYAAPPDGSALAAFGTSWLGRDAETGEDVTPPVLRGLSPERWRAITEDARHYAFHGTLKAPFALAPGKSYADLADALQSFAESRAPVSVPLKLARIAGFLAFVPNSENAPLHDLADACVETFDPFRQPETPEQVEKRRAGLNQAQSALLDRWGYPYVFEEFRFHMTLTNRLSDEEAAQLMERLAPLAKPALVEPLALDALCLFAQDSRRAPFRLVERFEFA